MEASLDIEQRITRRLAEIQAMAPDSINDCLHFRVGHCSPEERLYVLYVDTDAWVRNCFGSVHGGFTATMMDHGMGTVATCLVPEPAYTPSIEMNVSFLRPLIPGKEILLRIHADSVTRTLVHLHAEASHTDAPERICASASATFFIRPVPAA